MFGEPSKQIITGNVFLIICCAFYLLWWIIAFKPEGAVKGMKSGWLLIPAVVFGLMSIALLVTAFGLPSGYETLFKYRWVLIAGAVIYVMLLAVTGIFFHRIVTTELFLIVGWTVLGICEINTLFALAAAGKVQAWILIAITIVVGVVSMVCYMRYYDLDAMKGWVCGMIPLILVMVMMLLLTCVALGADVEAKETEDTEVSLFSKEKMVGTDIAYDDITDFYYTKENINFDAYYQRYRFYVEDGRHLFFHETRRRENEYGPCTEEDITLTGTIELSADQWLHFCELVKGGTVRARGDSADSGGTGPWLYLYWKDDKSKYQQFAFESYGRKTEFEEYCVSLVSGDQMR